MDNSRYTGEPMRDLILAKSVDFGKRAMDYARLRPGYPDSFHRRVLSLWQQAKAADRSKLAQLDSDGVAAFNDAHFEVKSSALPVADEPRPFKLLDIGCGPGIFGLRFAQLYPKFEVAGVDISDGQIEAANIRAVELGLQTRCSFAVATAEDTKQPDSSVDIAVAAQAWPWFQHDKAMKEIRRVLKPDGIFVIAQNCYLPNRDPVAKDTEDLVLKYNPNWKHAGGDGMYYSQVDQLVIQGGFELIEQFAYDVQFAFTHEGWRGRMRTCNGVGSGTLTDAQVEAWDADLQRLLEQKYPEQPLKVWHRMWGVAVSKL